MDTKKNILSAHKFYCQICDYHSSKISNYKQHVLSAKHQKAVNGNNVSLMETTALMQTNIIICNKCGHQYANRSGLWKHSAKCSQKDNTQLFLDIIKKDEDVKGFLMEQNKQLIEQNNKLMEMLQSNKTNAPTNITTNNVSNNSFNLNVYLTETCKDALNISEFVDSLVLNITDLENTARIGYANGISKIFITGLEKLDVCKRPVHCSDMKRSTLYIKNENQWIKEADDKPILTKAIKQVANKNIKNIFEWQKQNPEYGNPESKQNDRYNKLICETMSGSSNEEQLKNYEKIANNITKEVIIEKS
jgi:hypothetical protein